MHLAVLSCWSLLILVFLAKSDSFSTQNAFYHSRFASCLWQDGCQLTIAHSRFWDGIVDQHLAFHFLLGGLQKFLPPEVASKVLTALLFGVLGWLLVRRSGPRRRLIGALIFGGMFFLLFDSFARLLWGRPQLLGLVAFLLVWTASEKRIHWVWLVALGFFSALVSFETMVLLLLFSLALWGVDRSRRARALSVAAGAALSLFAFPFGLEKTHYFANLLTDNLLNSSRIQEWEGLSRPPFLLAISWILFLLAGRHQIFRNRIWVALVFASWSLTLFAVRFEYLAATLLVLGLIERGMSARDWSRVLPLIVLGGLGSAYWHYQEFRGDRTVFDARPVTRWLAREKPGEAVLNWRWEYWSSLIYADPRLVSAPGFSPLLFRHTDWFEHYSRLRNPNTSPNIGDFRQALRGLGTKLILADHRSGTSQKLRMTGWPLFEIYSDPQFSVFEYSTNRGAEPSLTALSLSEFHLQVRDVLQSALGWDWRDIYYSARPSSDPESSQRVRRLAGVLAFCKLAPQAEQCRSLLRSIQALDRSDWDLGALSLWGMILAETSMGQKLSPERGDLIERVKGFFDPRREQWWVQPGPGAHFQIGEALTFLASQVRFSDVPWLQAEIRRYADQFHVTQDFLRVRWLLGMLHFAQIKNPDASWIDGEVDYVLAWLRTRQNRKGCLTDPNRLVPAHIAGLMLEGLSYFVSERPADYRFASLRAGFQNCAFSEAPEEMYRRGYQVDIFGHVGNAVANLMIRHQ